MLLEIPKSLETHIIHQAGEQGIDPSQYALQILVQYATPFDYDLDRMKKAMQGLQTPKDVAKNTTTIPKGLAKDFDAFNQWMLERNSCK